MFYIDNIRGNYTGHRTHVKSLCVELSVPQTATAATQIYLNQDINATQLNGKLITQIVCNTIDTQAIDGSIGNITSPIKFPSSSNLINTAGLVFFGYTLTLVNKLGDYLVYDYPLTNLISTGQNTGILTNIPPRVYKFFNVEISAEESYISTFDPTQVITQTNIVSLEFFYIDKK